LVVSLCSLGAWADNTPDPCNLTAPSCTATCTNSPCQVSLVRNGNGVSMMYGNADASILCAPDHGTVTWATNIATPQLIGAFFNASHYPGSTSIVAGSSSSPATSTVTAPNAAMSCYVYSIVVCDATGSCSTVDPKVIVTGTHAEGTATKKKKNY